MIFWGRKNIAGECSLKYLMAPKLLTEVIVTTNNVNFLVLVFLVIATKKGGSQ